MDRDRLLEQFIRAEGYVAAGEHQLRKQRRRIRTLERGGHRSFARHATALLVELERSQEMHVIWRDRLRAKLDELAAAGQDRSPGRRLSSRRS